MDLANLDSLALVALLGATGWVCVSRWRWRLENNWPLAYYILLVVFANIHWGTVNPYVLYVAVISALFLRFEFLNERLVILVKIIETGCLISIGLRFLKLLFYGI